MTGSDPRKVRGRGMAAMNTVLALFQSGDHIIAGNDLYGGTYRLCRTTYEKLGLEFGACLVDRLRTLLGQIGDDAAVDRLLKGLCVDSRACRETAMESLLRILGKRDGGEIDSGPDPFVRISSPPLADVIRYINKYSNNVMARHLFLTMGAEAFEPPATLAKARKAAEKSKRKK